MRKRKDICKSVYLIILFTATIFTVYFGIKNEGVKVKGFLLNKGLATEDIEVERAEGKRNIYRTSEPIDIGDGEMVEYWEIIYSGVSGFLYSIKPYPDRELSKPKVVKLLFTIKEYEELERKTDGEAVEKYLKRIIINE